jgi:hypothetical protein
MKHPPATELLASVTRFLRDELLPTLSGARAFNLRVGINVVELVRREIEQQGAADARERQRLAELLGGSADLTTMRSELCDKIAGGALTLDDPALRAHLRATTVDRLAIDQPTYSAYRAAIAGSDAAPARKTKQPEE